MQTLAPEGFIILEPIIDDVVASFRPRLANKKVVIDIENDSLVLSCDRQLMLMLLNQYIDICADAHRRGVDFTKTNVHSGQYLALEHHQFDYLNEKLGCIYGLKLATGERRTGPRKSSESGQPSC